MTRSLDDIAADIVTWQRKTFPNSTVCQTIDHLSEEVAELRALPRSGEEMADCLFLLLAIADRAGVDLAAELDRKLDVNRRRTWRRTSAGYYRHVVPCGQ